MSDWFDNPWHDSQLGEALLVGSVEHLLSWWQAPAADVIGKLCTGAERWQAAIRRCHAPVNLADILRARTLI
jgi:hypothetical protein